MGEFAELRTCQGGMSRILLERVMLWNAVECHCNAIVSIVMPALQTKSKLKLPSSRRMGRISSLVKICSLVKPDMATVVRETLSDMATHDKLKSSA